MQLKPIRYEHWCGYACPYFQERGIDEESFCSLKKEDIPYYDGHIAICPDVEAEEEGENESH